MALSNFNVAMFDQSGLGLVTHQHKVYTDTKPYVDDFSFDHGASAAGQGYYPSNFMESPTLPPPTVFDTGLPNHYSGPSASAITMAPMPTIPAPINSSALAANLQRVVDTSANALQLDTTSLTPSGSPRTGGYPSPSFQLSPTPGLTNPTTTPGPRSHSRCSSHSSSDGLASGFTSVVVTPGGGSPVLPIRTSLGGGGRKNSAVANGTFIPKKSHLCPYPACERHTRTFRSNADLQRHIRSHKGEKPHKCPSTDCQKAYGQQNKMVKHVESQHPHLLSMVELGRTRTRRTPVAQRNMNVRRVSGNSPYAKPSALAYTSYPSTPVQSPPLMTVPTSAGSLYHSPIGFHHAHARPAPYMPRSGAPLHQMARTTSTGSTGSVGAGLGAGFPMLPSFNNWWAPS